MPRALADFSPIYTTEQVVLTFDFSAALGDGEMLINPPTVSVGLVSGTDPTPSSTLIGIPSIVGSSVLQTIGGLQPGAIYDIIATAPTSGGQILVLNSHQQCIAIA